MDPAPVRIPCHALHPCHMLYCNLLYHAHGIHRSCTARSELTAID
jgi:hypothetical protein